MATSPPASPSIQPTRPMSAMVRSAPRSSSRMSMSSKVGGSRASDEDGKTSVKVAVRVRPSLEPNDPGYELVPQRFQRSMVQTTSDTSLAIDSPQGKKLFVFDRVFGPDVMQEGVWEYLTECVDSFVQGYNVSLLAYGQSGAGKSYTMGTSGPAEQDDMEMMGVIPRAATALFEKLEGGPKGNPNRSSMSQLRAPTRYSQTSPKGERNWTLRATYVEIYNEQLRDLLLPEYTPVHERGSVTIREDVKGNIILTGLRQMEINSVDDLMSALNFGSTVRQTDATAINARSSRSHAVFSLNLVQKKSGLQSAPTSRAEKRFSVPLEAMTGNETFVTTDSKLHFVDLAGSERLKNTGAQGERAKEGISINAGLAALGKVISQLSSRQAGSHVSYRDSRLTRILQDSLGGNAITYMIACVTPAEFHLGETLNTVQYAQRARAIQSKPRIQQIEDGDKQAIIDRLKAEVSFLREQIRSAERSGGERRGGSAPTERSERSNEREAELQNQLLDIQENYTTLSHRHTKLIAEMAKARETEQIMEAQAALESSSGGDDATARLNRSSSFAQAVEQVVLEYEKTIQSLEQSLSSTRSTLSYTETNLLEKETKCAYVETINTQLQARLQKLMDREASTENYLHDLEAKLDGHTSGEEKNATIIMELRKEIARIRENEATCEDYISTLEERLAEADQDAELMQREVDRLEQVVERQRSLGKLDSLLYELDHIQQDSRPAEPEPEMSSGSGHRRTASRSLAERSRSHSHVSHQSHMEEPIPEDEEDVEENKKEPAIEEEEVVVAERAAPTPQPTGETLPADHDELVHHHHHHHESPAQSRYVEDKLESVTQELVDLRVEHESTLNEFDMLHAKYEEALRTLAELQDTIDEAKHPGRPPRDSVISATSESQQTRPSSFLSETKSNDQKSGEHRSSSRSLSSELSSALESPPTTMEVSDAETTVPKPREIETVPEHEPLPEQVATEERAVEELAVEQLAVEEPAVEEPAVEEPAVEEPAVEEPAAEAEQPEAESHVNGSAIAIAIELERLQSLAVEKEIAELELTERYAQLEQKHMEALDMVEELKTEVAKAQAMEASSPRNSTPIIRRKSSQNVMIIDRAHRSFASLRNIAAENFEHNPDVMQNFELNLNSAMHELHARSERIQELEADVAAAKKEMETKMTIISGLTRERSSLKASPMDMQMVSTLRDQLEKNERQLHGMQAAHSAREKELHGELEALRAAMENSKAVEGQDVAAAQEQDEAHRKKIAELEAELSSWENRHQITLESMQTTETEMRRTIEQLEADVAAVNAQLAESRSSTEKGDEAKETETKHQNLVEFLRNEIDEYKAIINSNAARVAELETAHAASQAELEEITRARDLATHQIGTQHQELVSNLESQIAAHEQTIQNHQTGLDELHTTHAREVDVIWTSSKKDYDEQLQILMSEHAENIKILEGDLTEAREDLMKVATLVAFALGLDVSVELITERIEDLISRQKALGVARSKNTEYEKHVGELSSINDQVMRDLEGVKATLTEMLGGGGGGAGGEDAAKSPYPSANEQLAAIRKRMYDLDTRNKKNSRLVEELEDQLQTSYDQAQAHNNRLSTLQTERNAQLEEAQAAKVKLQSELDTIKEEYAALQARVDSYQNGDLPQRSNSINSQIQMSGSHNSLPSPPPAIPLPPLPSIQSGSPPGTSGAPMSPTGVRPPSKDLAMSQIQEDQEARIRTIEKHLFAEKQLTSTLEEALTDLERQSNKVKADCDAWKRRCQDLEAELKEVKEKPQQDNRWSLHQIEEERKKRRDAELAREHLEARMNNLNSKKKKKGSLNCF